MTKIALIIAYDASTFSGWQRQANAFSVQEALETALSKIHAGRPCPLTAASRTDAGVHAQGQIACFETDKDYSAERWVAAINATTPRSIQIRKAFEVTPDFNPRVQNHGKHYRYHLWQGFTLPPQLINRAVCCPPLNIVKMQEGAGYLIGSHDFAAFRASDCQAKTTQRTIYEISITQQNYAFSYPLPHEASSLLQIDIIGSAFLKQMVRIIVGCLVEVGLEKQEPAWVQTVLQSRTRACAAQTMPPEGLCLLNIFLAPRT